MDNLAQMLHSELFDTGKRTRLFDSPMFLKWNSAIRAIKTTPENPAAVQLWLPCSKSLPYASLISRTFCGIKWRKSAMQTIEASDVYTNHDHPYHSSNQ